MRSERGLGLARRDVLGALLALACSKKTAGAPPNPSSTAQPSGLPAAAPSGTNVPPETHVSSPGSASPNAPSPAALLPATERTLEFSSTPVGKVSVVVSLPERLAEQKLPLLIALHGRGESLKGPARGARGWVDDYALPRAAARLRRPPLTAQDFEGFVERRRLDMLNSALAAEPHEGVAVACPYLPDIFSPLEPFTGAAPYAAFVIDVLLARLRAEFPLLATPQATGIDGVSLGGLAAVGVGLLRPEVFGAVGSLQAALDARTASELVERALAARQRNPDLKLRLLTSDDDFYNPTLRAIHGAFRRAEVAHDFVVVPGPHGYAFNRGPGAIEMLVYHDRVLRGRAPR